MVLQFLLGIPFMGYILALVLAVLSVAFAAVILGWVQLTLTKLLFLGTGLYLLLKFAIPQLLEKGLESKTVIFLVILTLLLVAMGIPGVILSTIGGV